MIDLHAHVLPGIDDGPEDLAGSLRMLGVAEAAGTRIIAATPHVRADHPRVVPHEIPQRVAELNHAAAREGLDIRVVPGGEIALLEALERGPEELRAVTLGGNGRDLLVETPWSPLASAFETLLSRVAGRGFRVLLAHPEMNRTLQDEPERLPELRAQGVLLQVTAASLAAAPRTPHARLALRALREGWIDVVASDGHAAAWRPPGLGEALAIARERVPEAGAELEWLVEDAPRAVLDGQPLPPRPRRSRRRSRWRWRRVSH